MSGLLGIQEAIAPWSAPKKAEGTIVFRGLVFILDFYRVRASFGAHCPPMVEFFPWANSLMQHVLASNRCTWLTLSATEGVLHATIGKLVVCSVGSFSLMQFVRTHRAQNDFIVDVQILTIFLR